MRILLLAPRYFGLGGAELYQRQFAETCAALGHRVVVASLHDGEMDPTERTLPWTTLENGSRVAQYIDYHGSKTDFVHSAWKWRRSYDLVVAGHVSLAPIAWAMRRPYIAICYGIDVFAPLPFVQHFALRRAKKIVCLSEYTVGMLCLKNGICNPKQFTVIHPAVEDWLLEAGKASVGAPRHDPFTLLTVARMDSRERYKGHDAVIKALSGTYRIGKVRYVIVGGGDDEQKLKDLAFRLSVSHMVEFTGPVPRRDLSRLYSECDLFVMPSTREGFGVVYLEAQAFGKPVIAGGGGPEEAMLDMVTGFSTHNQTNYDLTGRIVELAQDDTKRIEMGKAGREWIEKHFTMDRFAGEVRTLIGPQKS